MRPVFLLLQQRERPPGLLHPGGVIVGLSGAIREVLCRGGGLRTLLSLGWNPAPVFQAEPRTPPEVLGPV